MSIELADGLEWVTDDESVARVRGPTLHACMSPSGQAGCRIFMGLHAAFSPDHALGPIFSTILAQRNRQRQAADDGCIFCEQLAPLPPRLHTVADYQPVASTELVET
jgi:hypothetical protein